MWRGTRGIAGLRQGACILWESRCLRTAWRPRASRYSLTSTISSLISSFRLDSEVLHWRLYSFPSQDLTLNPSHSLLFPLIKLWIIFHCSFPILIYNSRRSLISWWERRCKGLRPGCLPFHRSCTKGLCARLCLPWYSPSFWFSSLPLPLSEFQYNTPDST